MTKKSLLAIFLILSATACATIAEKTRVEKFNETNEQFQQLLLHADYRGAAGFLDPEGRTTPIDFDRYKDIKIVSYDIIHSEVGSQGLLVEQEVNLQYFSLARNLVKTVDYRPVWRFNADRKAWFLKSFPLADVR